MNLALIKYFFTCSPLQICGLIFFSRKQKKERRKNHQEIQLQPLKIRLVKVRILIQLSHHFLIRGLALELLLLFQQLQLSKTSVLPLSLKAIFSVLKLLVPSSQQFLSHHLMPKLLVRTCFRDTELTLDFANQRYI